MQIKNISELGELIKTTRKSQGLTQKDLALVANVGVRLIIEMERGERNVNIGTVIKVCSLLGLNINIE